LTWPSQQDSPGNSTTQHTQRTGQGCGHTAFCVQNF
jgi:hypothetical protein